MKKLVLIQIAIAFSSCTLLDFAGAQSRPAEPLWLDETGRSDCISSGSIRDYQVLDDANLIVTAGAKRRYHVQLHRRAPGLQGSWQIGFKSTTGLICGGFDELIVDDGMGPRGHRISSIRKVSPEEYENLLVRFGKKEPAIKQAPAPKEIEGAEVEELD